MAIYDDTQIGKGQNVIVRSSNRFTILMGGLAVGLLQDLRCQDDYSPEPASGIGSISVYEYVPTLARYTISTSQACMFIASLRRIGVSFENGEDALKGMTFSIEVYDRVKQSSVIEGSEIPVTMAGEGSTGSVTTDGVTTTTATLLRRYEKCSFASGDIEIRKNAIIVTSATINACSANSNAANNGSRSYI